MLEYKDSLSAEENLHEKNLEIQTNVAGENLSLETLSLATLKKRELLWPVIRSQKQKQKSTAVICRENTSLETKINVAEEVTHT